MGRGVALALNHQNTELKKEFSRDEGYMHLIFILLTQNKT